MFVHNEQLLIIVIHGATLDELLLLCEIEKVALGIRHPAILDFVAASRQRDYGWGP